MRRGWLAIAVAVVCLAGSGPHARAATGDSVTDHTFVYGTSVRTYRLFVPARPARALVVAFHGLHGSSTSLEGYLDPVASTSGMIVAYPQGDADSWNAGGCCGGARGAGVDDAGFAVALISALRASFHPARVVVAGFSNGAMLAWRVACEHASSVDGLVDAGGTEAVAASRCHPSRPLTAMVAHGTADTTVPYRGGGSSSDLLLLNADPFRSVPATLDEWAWHDRCMRMSSARTATMAHSSWTGCADGVTLDLFAVIGMGHQVPTTAGGQPVDFGTMVVTVAGAA